MYMGIDVAYHNKNITSINVYKKICKIFTIYSTSMYFNVNI